MKNREQFSRTSNLPSHGFKLKLVLTEAELGFSQNMKVVDLLKSKNFREESIFKLCPDFKV